MKRALAAAGWLALAVLGWRVVRGPERRAPDAAVGSERASPPLVEAAPDLRAPDAGREPIAPPPLARLRGAASGPASGPSVAPSHQDLGVIEGNVFGPGVALLEGLEVQATYDSGGWSVRSTYVSVDDDGAFRFSGLALDTAYKLSAANHARSEVIVLDAARPRARVDLEVGPLARARVRVLDLRGEPMADAYVALGRIPLEGEPEILGSGRTGKEGVAVLVTSESGPVSVYAAYDCRSAPVQDCFLVPGAVTELSLEVCDALTLEGLLRTAEGEPVVGQPVHAHLPAEVVALDDETQGEIASTEEDSDSAGRFSLVCLRRPIVDLRVPVDEERGATFVHHHERFPGERVDGESVELVLSPRARVVGRVRSKGSLDIAISCAHRDPESGEGIYGSLELDEDGHFELLFGPEPESVRIGFWIDDQLAIVDGVTPRPGETVDLGVIEARALEALEVWICDVEGTPVPRPDVELQVAAGEYIVFADSDSAGRCSFEDIPRCPGSVLVRAHGFVPLEVPFEDPAELEGSRLVLSPTARLAGRLTSRSDALRGRAMVLLAQHGRDLNWRDGPWAQSDFDGSFVIHAPPGRWLVRVRPFTADELVDGPTVELVAGELREVVVELP